MHASGKTSKVDLRGGYIYIYVHITQVFHGNVYFSWRPQVLQSILCAPWLVDFCRADVVGQAFFGPRNAERILKPGGVICSQGECLWLNEDSVKSFGEDDSPRGVTTPWGAHFHHGAGLWCQLLSSELFLVVSCHGHLGLTLCNICAYIYTYIHVYLYWCCDVVQHSLHLGLACVSQVRLSRLSHCLQACFACAEYASIQAGRTQLQTAVIFAIRHHLGVC